MLTATPGGAAVGVVLQRHRDVGRVDQHHVGGRHVAHHPAPGGGELAGPDRALDERVALALLVLLLDLVLGHPDLLADLAPLEGVVGAGHHQPDHGDDPQQADDAVVPDARAWSDAGTSPPISGSTLADRGVADERDDRALHERPSRPPRAPACRTSAWRPGPG